jgi:hypothetical protein
VPIIIDKIKVFLDFHIFAILEFNLFIGYPIEKLSKKILPMGGLVKSLGKLLPPLI